MARSSSGRKYIDKILYGDSIPNKSDLVHLSDMSEDDLASFTQEWVKVGRVRRQAIISQLVHLGGENYKLDFSKVFRYCLDDADSGIRSGAIAGLSEEEDEMFISSLIRFIKEDTVEEVRWTAIKALGKFAILGELGKLSVSRRDEIYNTLWSLLQDKNEPFSVRGKALEAVAAFHVPQVIKLIEEAYNSPESFHRISALRAMGRNCDLLWLDTLIKEIDNNDIEIRCAAISACGEINADEAVPILIDLTGDSNVRVREAAIKSLGEIGGQEARKTLNNLVRNSKGRTKQAAVSAIKELDICEDFLSMNY